jgi:hypothetical protein
MLLIKELNQMQKTAQDASNTKRQSMSLEILHRDEQVEQVQAQLISQQIFEKDLVNSDEDSDTLTIQENSIEPNQPRIDMDGVF